MARWTIPEMDEHTPALVRDAWRKSVDGLAEKPTAQRDKSGMKVAALAGVAIGVAGSAAIYLLT